MYSELVQTDTYEDTLFDETFTQEDYKEMVNAIKKFGEVFTPPPLVNEILHKLPKKVWKRNKDGTNKKWLDPTCGNGAFLIEIKRHLLELKDKDGINIYTIDEVLGLNGQGPMLYGVDIQEKNIIDCIKNLYDVKEDDVKTRIKSVPKDKVKQFKGKKGVKKFFGLDGEPLRNILCADGLIYDYNFGEDGDQRTLDFYQE